MRGSAAFRAAVAPGGVLAGPWVENELWRRARAVPSLDLQFADNKSLVDATTGASLVTFTRASSGTYVGSDGLIKTAATNEARFDHNPTTGESLGLLVEEQRTNLTLRSQEFDNASWSKTRCSVTPNATTAPDGTLTADKLVEDTSVSVSHTIRESAAYNFISGTTYTYSVYAKAGERSRLKFQTSTSPSTTWPADAIFDLVNGVVVSNIYGTASIYAAGNGWYRCIITAAAVSTVSTTVATFLAATSGSSYTGDGTSGFYLWGAQLEAGAFPTSYISTTTATVTRSADVASISGSNFSSWYRQDEGTVFVEGIAPAVSCNFVGISDGTNNNRVLIDSGTNSKRLTVTVGGVSQATINKTYVYGTSTKSAGAFKLDSFQFSDSGTLGTEDTSGTLPTVDRAYIGSNAAGALPVNGQLKRLTYWPARLSNSTLQTITQP